MTKNLHRAMAAGLLCAGPAAADWGAGATWQPGWQQVREAAWSAAVHPMTWVPALLGAGVWASGEDERWTDEIIEEAPLFGNVHDANVRSDDLRTATDLLWLASVIATDSGDDMWRNKGQGALVQIGAVQATIAGTNAIKAITDREAPLADTDPDDDALLSQHATNSFAHAALIRENMRYVRAESLWKDVWIAAGYVTATGSAYGRIEAGGHHISDQLLGAAFGNFMATFINTAFMGDSDARVDIGVSEEGIPMVGFTLRY